MKLNRIFLSFSFFMFLSFSFVRGQAFEKIVEAAATDKKNILLIFSGSDWCIPCMKLDKHIISNAVFQEEAQIHWIIYKADFPRKKINQLPEDIQKQNILLAEKYNQEGYFPFIILLDSNKKVLGKTTYTNDSPGEFINLLHSFEKQAHNQTLR